MAKSKYDNVAMSLHWTIAALMIFMIFFGEDLMRSGTRGAPVTNTLPPSLHVTIGVSILALSLFRLMWRVMNPPPSLPETMAPWELAVAKLTHITFYVLMIGLPLTGWLAFPRFLSENPAMSGVKAFGVLPVPAAPDLGIPAGLVHSFASNVAMALVILHILAALKHQFVNRDGVLQRMSPR